MKFFPLHIKTALLASLISFAVLVVGLVVVSANIARKIQNAQKELAVLQVENLVEQLSSTQDSFDTESIRNLTNILSGSRPNLVTVRLWRLENGRFAESVASDDSLQVEELSDAVQLALQQGSSSTTVRTLPDNGDSFYRVLSPIVRDHKVTGAVEGIEKLDTIRSISL